ncbi:MipA/OmpV family protein [Marinovum sp. 2_MG-2023]|uniref:MipA/OmpV family protein n=1 Tax=unclassified Marinovum TaxID=2647166 RepID=UPI0026E385F1|nr:MULTISPECIES: MipA/OmpV family protein [unclassified Marinovum]MDO6729239.1 MipA/OmpV family protein [Marinovum sp. 2_MG-2023]MDO6779134.1 MipA/OmpV family protein [Marinovum sp. 1_MG-2023]
MQARAQESHDYGPGDTKFSFSLGLGASQQADYEGSDDYETSAVPLVHLGWNDRITFSTLEGPTLTVKAFESHGWRADVGLGYDFGRAEDDNKALKGLGDVDSTATFLAKLEYGVALATGDVSFGLDVERDLGGDREGTRIGVGAAYGVGFAGERGKVEFGIHANWADDNYMSTMFGISSTQSANADLVMAQHDASAGWKDVGVSLSGSYGLTKNWALVGEAAYSKLLGDAADSPLVADYGAEGQTSLGMGVLYTW